MKTTYKTEYEKSTIRVYKNNSIIFETRYVLPDNCWFDFEHEGVKYSLQCLSLFDENIFWFGVWNISKVGEFTSEENVLKSSVLILTLSEAKS